MTRRVPGVTMCRASCCRVPGVAVCRALASPPPGPPAPRAVPEEPDPGLASHTQTFLRRFGVCHLGRAPRSKGRRSGRGHSPASPGSHLSPVPLLREGAGGRTPCSPPDPSPLPTYCFIVGPGTNIPRSRGEGGKCRTMVGPAAAAVTPPGLGGCQRPPAAGLGRGTAPLHPLSSRGEPESGPGRVTSGQRGPPRCPRGSAWGGVEKLLSAGTGPRIPMCPPRRSLGAGFWAGAEDVLALPAQEQALGTPAGNTR